MEKHYQNQYAERMSASGFYAMEQYSSAISAMLLEEKSQMDLLFKQQSVRKLIISGEKSGLEVLDVLQFLSGLTEGDTRLRNAFLYVKASDMVLTSNKTTISALDSEYSDLLQDMRAGVTVGEDRLYIKLPYPDRKPLAMLVFCMDLHSIYRQSMGEYGFQNGFSSIYVYDRDGQPVFREWMQYPEKESLLVDSAASFFKADSVHRVYKSGNQYLLVYQPTGSDMLYVRTMAKVGGWNGRDILMSVWQVWLPCLIILIIASYILVVQIYQPFNQILNKIMGGESQDLQNPIGDIAINEVDFLQRWATEDEKQKNLLSGMIVSARDSIESNIIRQLLVEEISRPAEQEEIRNQLKGIKSQMPICGDFYVAAVYMAAVPSGKRDMLRENMAQIAVEKSMSRFWAERMEYHVTIHIDKYQYVILWTKDESKLQKQLRECEGWLQELLEPQGYRVTFGLSKRGEDIFALHRMSEESVEDLRMNLYYAKQDRPQDQKEKFTSLQELLQGAVSLRLSPEIIRMRIQELSDSETCLMLLDMTMEQLTLHHAMIPQELRECRENFLEGKDFAGIYLKKAQLAIERALEILQDIGRNDQYRYVARACELIEENYYDSTLSLEGISVKLGISPQYMSRLFAQWKETGFLNFLNAYRVEQAKSLLVSTGFGIEEIGMKTGFSSAQNFIRVFKKYEDCTPGQYRKAHRA